MGKQERQEIEIPKIDEIKTQTAIKKIMDKGEVIERRLVTKITFEGELSPESVAQIHRLLHAGVEINVSIWSPQLSMIITEKHEDNS